MKVKELLKTKSDIESEIKALKQGSDSVRMSKSEKNGSGEKMTVRLFTHNTTRDVKIPHGVVSAVIDEHIICLEEKLEPINKKLDAIELMLNS